MLDIHLTKVAPPMQYILITLCFVPRASQPPSSLLLRAALLFSLSHHPISIVGGVNATSILDNLQEWYRFIFII